MGILPEECVIEEDWQVEVRNAKTKVTGKDLPEGTFESLDKNGAVCKNTDDQPCEDYEIRVACLGESLRKRLLFDFIKPPGYPVISRTSVSQGLFLIYEASLELSVTRLAKLLITFYSYRGETFYYGNFHGFPVISRTSVSLFRHLWPPESFFGNNDIHNF